MWGVVLRGMGDGESVSDKELPEYFVGLITTAVEAMGELEQALIKAGRAMTRLAATLDDLAKKVDDMDKVAE